MATVLTERRGQRLLIVASSRRLDKTDWAAQLELIVPSVLGILVVAPPGCPGPSATERRGLIDRVDRTGDLQMAVIVSAAAHRGIVTALNWLSRDAVRIKAFSPKQWPAALDHARFVRGEYVEVRRAAVRMARQLDVSLATVGLGRTSSPNLSAIASES